MSQENVETIRAVYEKWEKGDFRAGGDLWDQRVIFIMANIPETPEGGYFIGPEGGTEFMRTWLKPWTGLTIAAEEFIEAENSVVVAAHQRAAGQGSGAAAELRQFHVWTFRGRTVIRLETFKDRAEALEAVGLRE